MAENKNQGNNRGFAGMDPEKQREIASKGGRAAHQSGHANQFDSKTGAEAGRRGGQTSRSAGESDKIEGFSGEAM